MKLTKQQCRRWFYAIAQLRKHFNPGVPVCVASRPARGFGGDCGGILKLGRLTEIKIRINSDEPWGQRYEALIHEWAHAMLWGANWTDESTERIHGPTWGVWYAAIYEHLFERCWGDMTRKGLIDEIQMKLFPLPEYEWRE